MIKNKDKIMDDIARVASGGVSVFSGISQNIREDIKSRVDEMAERLDLVPREKFEALELRIKALEEIIEKQSKKSTPKSTTKPETKKTSTKKK